MSAPSAASRASDGLWFGKDLSQPEPIPEAGIERAVALMRSGRLHRYGETGAGTPEPALLEQEFAAYVGTRYCVALNSCGATLFVALKALGVVPGDRVLTSAFTLAPVPGAIAHACAEPVLVDTTADYTTDLEDLERKVRTSGARVFLISHMRGHITDLAAVRSICDAHGVALVEDCAHTMGARWDGRPCGTWGRIGCFSTQTYKHINSGEGGLLVTDDDDICARAILYSGSYMFYGQHLARPAPEVFERWKYDTPNFSLRMSNHAAAMLRPQLSELERRAARWNALYGQLARELKGIDGLHVPRRGPKEEYVASSIQFTLDLPHERIERFLEGCERRGLFVKWFGSSAPRGFTSNYTHWHYLNEVQELANSPALMDGLCDMRIPLSLSGED
ncbi:MAG: DegT/DnrJ/EryC1/StrS aminotransferase family protein, partial [Gammaproteobacteria bacterium]|nr:DegT/DnrJ/EryC1/StrS aminotransferase family protein [Gammaproteobacteria bacterium]